MKRRNAKPWGPVRNYSKRKGRKENIISDRQVILIACEGEATEPNYFRSFPIDPARVEIEGKGYNSDSLVEFAIRKMNEAKKARTPYLQVWCVFDRDRCPPQNIYRAFQLAKNHKIRIAYSNEAFELWYVLHYQFLNTACDRNELCKKLNKLARGGYEKKQGNMYQILREVDGDAQRKAIAHAKKLEKIHDPGDKQHNNPSTTVYKLVEALNDLIDG